MQLLAFELKDVNILFLKLLSCELEDVIFEIFQLLVYAEYYSLCEIFQFNFFGCYLCIESYVFFYFLTGKTLFNCWFDGDENLASISGVGNSNLFNPCVIFLVIITFGIFELKSFRSEYFFVWDISIKMTTWKSFYRSTFCSWFT